MLLKACIRNYLRFLSLMQEIRKHKNIINIDQLNSIFHLFSAHVNNLFHALFDQPNTCESFMYFLTLFFFVI